MAGAKQLQDAIKMEPSTSGIVGTKTTLALLAMEKSFLAVVRGNHRLAPIEMEKFIKAVAGAKLKSAEMMNQMTVPLQPPFSGTLT